MPRLNKDRVTRKTVWKGPVEDGVTFSLLSRFLVCRERFRLYVVEGLTSAERWSVPLGYGNMWHVCEEAVASEVRHFDEYVGTTLWTDELKAHTQQQCRLFPMQQEEIGHWYQVCRLTFPVYLDYWNRRGGNEGRTPLLREQVFDVPYRLPSGRVVRLRGKWDGVDRISGKVWLVEHKTKGEVDGERVVRQLQWDLQTMLYVVAFHEECNAAHSAIPDGAQDYPFAGVLYQVARRPLSGGKGSIRRHQPSKSNPHGESREEFYSRLKALIEADPQDYFFRWNVEITEEDVQKFRRQCLDPILEQLCDWWDWVGALKQEPFDIEGSGGVHFRMPYGVYSPLLEGRETDLDSYLTTGQTVGLQRVDSVFPELQ